MVDSFRGGVSATGLKAGETTLTITAGSVTKTVPVTVMPSLFPRIPDMPRHLTDDKGSDITVTETTPGTYHIKGVCGKGAGFWTQLIGYAVIPAGTYSMESSVGITPTSWTLGVQAGPDDDETRVVFEPGNYGAKALAAGSYGFRLFINDAGTVDQTVTPMLTRVN